MNLNHFVIFFLFLGMSCESDRDTSLSQGFVTSITDIDIEKHDKVLPEFEALPTNNPINYIRDMLIVGDSLLVLNQLYQSDSNLLVINFLNSKNSLGNLVGIGDGPNSVTAVEGLASVSGRVQFYDPTSRKLHEIRNIHQLHSGNEHLETISTLPVMCRNAFVLDSTVICVPLDAGPVANSRFALYSKTGKLNTTYGEFPKRILPMDGRIHYDERMNNVAYEAVPTLLNDGTGFALAYKYKDRIEIYTMEGKLKKAIDGPDFFDPDFAQHENHEGGLSIRSIPDVTNGAFISVTSNSKVILALYSGMLDSPSNPDSNFRSYATRKLFAFDWDGQLIGSYRLPFSSHAIAVSEDGTLFIASDDDDIKIYQSYVSF